MNSRNDECEHVGDDLVDYAEGYLPPDRRAAVSAHLDQCPECAQDLAWVRAMMHTILARGLRHLSPERLVFLSENEAELPSASEQVHLASCRSCRDELAWAGRLPTLEALEGMPGEDASAPEPATGVSPLRGPLERAMGRVMAPDVAGIDAAARTTVAAAIRFFAGLGRGLIQLEALRALAGPELLPVRITRSGAPGGEFDRARLLGLESYEAGDFSQAAKHLARAHALRPDDAELLIYLGSTHRQLGDRAAAAEALERAVSLATDPLLTEESRWQLAHLYLASGDARAATKELLEIVGARGNREREAADALRRVFELAAPEL